MIGDFFSRMVKNDSDVTTYSVALLQSKAYRALKKAAASCLKKYNISLSEWMIIGALSDSPNVHLVEIANLLDVRAPLVTNLITELEGKSLIIRVNDPKDPRAHLIKLSKKGHELVPTVEADLRALLKSGIKGVSVKELMTYVKVLSIIIENIK